jgi:hypothetical protein
MDRFSPVWLDDPQQTRRLLPKLTFVTVLAGQRILLFIMFTLTPKNTTSLPLMENLLQKSTLEAT